MVLSDETDLALGNETDIMLGGKTGMVLILLLYDHNGVHARPANVSLGILVQAPLRALVLSKNSHR